MKNLGLVLKRLHRPASSYIKGIPLEIKDDTLLDVFRTSCEKYATKMMGSLKFSYSKNLKYFSAAFDFDGSTFTFEEMDTHSSKIASGLISLGAHPESVANFIPKRTVLLKFHYIFVIFNLTL